jgi:hypothetical protein
MEPLKINDLSGMKVVRAVYTEPLTINDLFRDRLYVADAGDPHPGRWVTNGHIIVRAEELRHIEGIEVVGYMEPGRYTSLIRDKEPPPKMEQVLDVKPDSTEVNRTDWRQIAHASETFTVFVNTKAPWFAVAISGLYARVIECLDMAGTYRYTCEGPPQPVAMWRPHSKGPHLVGVFMPLQQQRFEFNGKHLLVTV